MFCLLRFVSGVPPTEAAMAALARRRLRRATRRRVSRLLPQAAQRGAGRPRERSPISLTIGAGAKRAPLPDVLITRRRSAILVARARRQLAASRRRRRRASPPRWTRFRSREHRRRQRPALRGAGRLLPARPRPAAEILLLPLRDGAQTSLARPRRRRSAETCAHADLARRPDASWSSAAAGARSACGWRRRYPSATITAVSNSAAQGAAITATARARGLANLTVITADMNDFEPDGRVRPHRLGGDVRAHGQLARAARTAPRGWLTPDGRLFLHVFTHRAAPYRFDVDDKADWIAQHFFTGGIMPSHGLIRAVPRPVRGRGRVALERRALPAHGRSTGWRTSTRNARAIDRRSCAPVYGAEAGVVAAPLAAVLPGHRRPVRHRGGEVWGVSHYRLKPA